MPFLPLETSLVLPSSKVSSSRTTGSPNGTSFSTSSDFLTFSSDSLTVVCLGTKTTRFSMSLSLRVGAKTFLSSRTLTSTRLSCFTFSCLFSAAISEITSGPLSAALGSSDNFVWSVIVFNSPCFFCSCLLFSFVEELAFLEFSAIDFSCFGDRIGLALFAASSARTLVGSSGVLGDSGSFLSCLGLAANSVFWEFFPLIFSLLASSSSILGFSCVAKMVAAPRPVTVPAPTKYFLLKLKRFILIVSFFYI